MREFIQQYWHNLSFKEQALIKISIPVVTVLVMFYNVVIPQQQRQQDLELRLKLKQKTFVWMQDSAKTIAKLNKIDANKRKTEFSNSVYQLFFQNKVQGFSFRPIKKNEISVISASADYDKLYRALIYAEDGLYLSVKSADIKFITQNTVSFNIVLVRNILDL